MLKRYSDASRTFVTILNFIMRMRQYHTRSYQYDQVILHTLILFLFLIHSLDQQNCWPHVCSLHSLQCVFANASGWQHRQYLQGEVQRAARQDFPRRVSTHISTSQSTSFLLSRQEGLNAFEELFIYACPKFITANPPPYEDPNAINAILNSTDAPSSYDSTQHHLNLFLADVAAHLPVPTLRSFLKLYTSLDAKKLANFLDVDEEEMVQELMVLKQASKSLNRVPGMEGTGLLDAQMTTTSDLNFVIDEVSRQNRSFVHLIGPALEYGTYRRINRWSSLCGMVHQKHGTRTKNIWWLDVFF